MPAELTRDEILLHEYSEAATQCRQIESLTRTSLAIFLPAATALIGFQLTAGHGRWVNFILSIAGLLVSLLMLNTIQRSQNYYRRYMERAKQIEAQIVRGNESVMSLYTRGYLKEDDARSISNKTAIRLVMGIASIYFLVAAVVYACMALRG